MADGPSRAVEESETQPQAEKATEENGIPTSDKSLVFNVHVKAQDKQVNQISKHLLDTQSISGQFGWVSLGGNNLPYILRRGRRYCAVRMVEKYLLSPYLDVINSVVYKNCANFQTYYITTWEQRLLNEINSFHCDYLFGRVKFSATDLVVLLNDIIEFYQFLVTCQSKLLNVNPSYNKFGFLLIDKTSTVPFVVKDDEKHLPLFYLDGAEHLESSSVSLSGWDLAYLKLAFRVQKIREEFIEVETCACVPFSVVKRFFPSGTIFQESWPKTINLGDFIGKRSEAPNQRTWLRTPTANCNS